MSEESKKTAQDIFKKAYELQMAGELEDAIDQYKRSIEIFPTAEAHTFLGWTYSFQGHYDEAISECKKAIKVDPDFGNPYNDIGAYLIERGALDEAIPWLRKAMTANATIVTAIPITILAVCMSRKGNGMKRLNVSKHRLRLTLTTSWP